MEDSERASERLRQAEHRLAAIVQNSAEIVKIVKADGTLLYANPAFGTVYGYDPEQAVESSMNVVDYTHPDDLAKVAEDTQRALNAVAAGASEPPTHTTEYRFLCADGSYRHIEGTATYLLDEPGIEGVVINARDITERKEAERDLVQERGFLRATLESLKVGIVACDAEGNLTLFNQATQEFHGAAPDESDPDEWAGRYALYRPDGQTQMRREEIPLYRAYTGEIVRDAEMIIKRKDGSTIRILADGQSFHDAEGNKLGAVVAMHDVTERMELQRELEHRAFHDPLTELPNRRLFEDRLEHTLTRSQRSREPLAVLFMDLDAFKPINDDNGHDAGDELLVAVAGRLRATLRPEDTICRLGGDEFVILLEGMNREAASAVAERVTTQLHEPFRLSQTEGASEVEVRLTTSIGVAVADPVSAGEYQPARMLREADAAMYRAKRSGKACYEVSVVDI